MSDEHLFINVPLPSVQIRKISSINLLIVRADHGMNVHILKIRHEYDII